MTIDDKFPELLAKIVQTMREKGVQELSIDGIVVKLAQPSPWLLPAGDNPFVYANSASHNILGTIMVTQWS